MNVPDFTVTSVFPGCECQPVEEFGPKVKSATIVFVPGLAAKPMPPCCKAPAPMISVVIDPVPPVASATPVRATDAKTMRAAVASLACVFMVPIPSGYVE